MSQHCVDKQLKPSYMTMVAGLGQIPSAQIMQPQMGINGCITASLFSMNTVNTLYGTISQVMTMAQCYTGGK